MVWFSTNNHKKKCKKTGKIHEILKLWIDFFGECWGTFQKNNIIIQIPNKRGLFFDVPRRFVPSPELRNIFFQQQLKKTWPGEKAATALNFFYITGLKYFSWQSDISEKFRVHPALSSSNDERESEEHLTFPRCLKALTPNLPYHTIPCNDSSIKINGTLNGTNL